MYDDHKNRDCKTVDRFVLCCRCGVARGVCPFNSAELARLFGLLSRTYLPATFPVVERHHPVVLVRSRCTVHCAYMGRLGQLALVLEPGYQLDLRPIGNVASAMGASVSKGRLPAVQPPQASTYSCILFRGS